MSEKIDIYDEKFNFIGVSDKKLAHQTGYWHKSIICIVFNPETKSIILQKKVPGRYFFDRPDYLDFSVGGHYKSGEVIADGVREIKEELGIEVNFKKLISLGVRKKSAKITDSFIENEFQYIFILPLNLSLSEYAIDGEEVNGLVEINIEEGLKLFKGQIDNVECEVVELEDRKKLFKNINIRISDFVPSYLKDRLYERLFIQVEKYLKNEKIDKWDFND